MNGPLSSVEEDQQEHDGSEDISEVEVDVPRVEAARLERGLHEQAVDRQVEAVLEKVVEVRLVLHLEQEPSGEPFRAGRVRTEDPLEDVQDRVGERRRGVLHPRGGVWEAAPPRAPRASAGPPQQERPEQWKFPDS